MEAGSNMGVSSLARESPRRKMVWQAWQEQALLSAFSKSKYLSFAARQDLAGQMGVPDSRIRVWFQNRRSPTGAVGHAPNRSTAGSRQLASRQLQKELGSREQGGGMPSDHRQPRTRITLPQSRILLEAFERNPRPGFATREELAQRTGLPEDTIHIWFQNRRARHTRRGRPTAQGQDLLDSRGEDEAPGGPGGREHEGARDSLLPLATAGVTDTSNPSDLPTFCTEAQPSQLEEPSGPEQEVAPKQGSTTGPPQLLLCQQLDQIQMEDLVPAPLHLHGVLRGREPEGAQDSLLPLTPARGVAIGTSSPSDLPTFCTECPPSQLQEPSGPGQAHAPTQASNTDPLEFFLDQVLTQVQVNEHRSAPLDLEPMDTIPELPLTQEDYQALLDIL
ncbi:double homeobox protein 4-like protein 2 [Grammomys surdaster]|uniref:double homeobox protein 4-like protein 2 n=1 Tax=Grammomys surdaster TaxID=491861 RepID=UPI00109FCE4E|nr:double homeobox protein 4-like protein 2 [Grammomys surdaster]